MKLYTPGIKERNTIYRPEMNGQGSQSRRGVILLNLGTPEQPRAKEVSKYLKEFLMDPLVLDMNYVLRWFLVHCLILPKRSVNSAAAYQKVWTERGSPLLFHLLDLVEEVEKILGNHWIVKPAMRYGAPSISSALEAFQKESIQEILVFPLYPQYSLAATESSILECRRVVQKEFPEARLRFVDPFYAHPLFIDSYVKVISDHLQDYSYDHLLFSFHGLPERQVKKTDRKGSYCLEQSSCCECIVDANQDCYRAQCFSSARLMAKRLGLGQDKYTICFQSRLGNTPWIKPFTDEFYRELPKKGVKRLAVVCPAFVADCLETLEEVQIRGKEEFISNGGEDLTLVPSLNSTQTWAKAVGQIVLSQEWLNNRAEMGSTGN